MSISRIKNIHVDKITEVVKHLCIDANHELRPDTVIAYKTALEKEKSPVGKEVLQELLKNAEYSRQEGVPFCSDCGYAVFFIELGQNVHIQGGSLTDAINEGVRQGYGTGYLRKSIIKSPLLHINTGDNTPATIHYEIVPGDHIKLSLLVKGCGCDNVSAIKMLTPAEGIIAAKKFIIETVDRAGPNASPPFVIGIGLGGPFAHTAFLAQKALLWEIGKPNPDPKLAELEKELLDEINDLGIGPAGFGGTITALGLHIEASPTHMASFPVAVNIDCHSHRGKEAIIQ